MQKKYDYAKSIDDSRLEQLADEKMGLFLALYLVLLVFMGASGYMIGRERVVHYTTVKLNAPKLNQLPSIALNMQNSSAKSGAIRFAFSLEVAVRDSERVQGFMPIIMDRVQTILNETPVENLKNRTELHFVKENMLTQINLVTTPTHVRNIYIEKLITTK